jgi:integrase
MMAGREHRVPLVPRCIELLQKANLRAAGSDFVFPARSSDKPMSNMVLLMTMRRMKSDYTVHGFRSAFRASERTTSRARSANLLWRTFVKDKTEAAYRRGDLFEKRRELMATWATFVTAAQADIIPLRKKCK